jgi:hypothetical protein
MNQAIDDSVFDGIHEEPGNDRPNDNRHPKPNKSDISCAQIIANQKDSSCEIEYEHESGENTQHTLMLTGVESIVKREFTRGKGRLASLRRNPTKPDTSQHMEGIMLNNSAGLWTAYSPVYSLSRLHRFTVETAPGSGREQAEAVFDREKTNA